MLGKGYLHIYDFDVLFKGYGSLQVGLPEQLASVIFTGTGVLYTNGTTDYIRAYFPGMAGQLFETVDGYGGVSGTFPPMAVALEEYAFVPSGLEYIFALFPSMVCSMTTTDIDPGEINATFPSLVGRIYEEEEYGEISATFPSQYGLLFEGGPPQEAWLLETILCLDAARGDIEHIIFIDETGTITNTVSASRILIAAIIEQVTASDSASLLATFYAPGFEAGTIYADGNLEVGSLPGLEIEDRVWVVNIDTGASSQYYNFGFNSFFTDEATGIDYGVADDGIYQLDVTTDQDSAIEYLLEVGKSNYGSHRQKKSYAVYVGAKLNGDTFLKVDIDGIEKVYSVGNTASMQPTRVGLSHRHTGTYWNLTLVGNDCNISDIEFKLLPRGRRTSD